MSSANTPKYERFPIAEVSGLREELMQSGLDSWQAAALVKAYLDVRGYAGSFEEMVAARFQAITTSNQLIEKLEKCAICQ
jgi:hypothetical protein